MARKPFTAKVHIKLLIAGLVFLAYLPALRGGYIWDDDDYVMENRTLRSVRGLGEIWLRPGATPQYYPLVFTTFWGEYRLWGLNPTGYHITNLILHLLAGLLLWRCLKDLGVPAPWLAALIFVLHPVHVESVAWITERKNVLSLVFYLGSAFLLIRHFGLAAWENLTKRTEWREYVAAFFLFAAALLSKTVTFSLPAAMLLLIWWKRGCVRGREVMALAPFFILGLTAGLVTAWLERHHVGAQGVAWDFGLVERILIAGRALWFYAAKIIAPVQLMFNYPRWSVDGTIGWQYLYPLAGMTVILLLWKYRQRLGRGPLTAVFYFCCTLFPALGFIDVYPFRYSFVADHFQYHAAIGLIVLAVAMGVFLMKKARRGLKRTVVAVFIFLLAGRTYYQCYDYPDLETLWRRTLHKNPGSWLAHNNLGTMLHVRGADEQALAHYRAALHLEPQYTEALNNLGSFYIENGDPETALYYYHAAVDADPENASALYNLGKAYADQGKPEMAAQHYRKALRIDPGYAMAHNNLGLVLTGQGLWAQGIAHYKAAVQANPDLAEPPFNLGMAMLQNNDPSAAMQYFQKALEIDPRYAAAHNQLGMILFQNNQARAALHHFRLAHRLAPDNADFQVHFGIALAQAGHYEEAVRMYTKAIALSPDRAEIFYNSGCAYAAMGKLTEACEQFRKALHLKPVYAEARINLGVTLARTGNLASAEQCFLEIIKDDPENGAAHKNLCQAQWLMGEHDKARRTFGKLKEISMEQAAALKRLIPEIGAGG